MVLGETGNQGTGPATSAMLAECWEAVRRVDSCGNNGSVAVDRGKGGAEGSRSNERGPGRRVRGRGCHVEDKALVDVGGGSKAVSSHRLNSGYGSDGIPPWDCETTQTGAWGDKL